VILQHFTSLNIKDKGVLALVLLFLLFTTREFLYQSIYAIALPIQPMVNDTVNPNHLLANWNNMSTLELGYNLEVDTNKEFTNPTTICNRTSGYDCKMDEQLKPNTTYYMRIRTTEEGEPNTWSRTRKFYTGENVPTNAIREMY
jgi:hypothetical protein